MSQQPYFFAFLREKPPRERPLGKTAKTLWHGFAGATIGFGLWYLHWRWTASLNPEAMVFSVFIAACETAAFVGTALFFFDIWDEKDTEKLPPPESRMAAGLEGEGEITVDIFVTTFDEDPRVVEPSLAAAKAQKIPARCSATVFLLDDGNRSEMRELAEKCDVGYLSREGNRGFKAGNLANALFQTNGDFIAICDADTQLFPSFLQNTLGYFRDPKVSWVQTPHWFYDLPEGQKWSVWLTKKFGKWARFAAPIIEKATGQARCGDDLFLSNPALFFDVIQRRRNRNFASFCCGAGSIHRREAVFENAMLEQGKQLNSALSKFSHLKAQALLPRMDLQPFKYHVSEDIFTSIQQHQKGWKSVYHPDVEARMLSPWSITAWAIQKLKYAGGTFDIMLHANPLFKSGMRWRTKLHYLATFWSYLAIFWLPILILAPAVSLVTGQAPMASYSADFFLHVLPVLIANELAMNFACKGNNLAAGRMLSIGTLFIQWRAFLQVMKGQKPHFPPTPKTPTTATSLRHAVPNILLLVFLLSAVIYGAAVYFRQSGTYSTAFFTVNSFWIVWASLALFRVTLCALVKPNLPTAA